MTLITLFGLAPQSQAISLKPLVVQGLRSPVGVAVAPGEAQKIYILEQEGRIRVLQAEGLRKTPFLDISSQVVSGGELGLLGLAFHPDYERNGRYFVNYTTGQGSRIFTVVSEFNRSGQQERVLLRQRQPYQNHNGGHIAFGPDGYLYISFGDGGSAGDPLGSGQDTRTILGAILRIDVDREQPYAIPQDNPFVAGGGRPEIYAYGLRNVWKFSFDRGTGFLYGADVGQDTWEEINIIVRGGNYGWNTLEGKHCFRPASGCSAKGMVPPIWEYPRTDGISVTGGYVYRGVRIPSLNGIYLYADWGSGKIWGLKFDPQQKKVTQQQLLLETQLRISAFGELRSGELIVLDQRGQLYRIEP